MGQSKIKTEAMKAYELLLLLCLTVLTTACFGQRYSWGNRFHQKNIYNDPLEICSLDPVTGWFRDGYARTDNNDRGLHVVCATMTQEVRFSTSLTILLTTTRIFLVFGLY